MTAETIEIRAATVEDCETLTRIAHASKAHWGYPREWMEMWREDLTLTSGFVAEYPVFCAESEGEIQGFYALKPLDSDDEAEGWEIEHCWVDPKAIGKGLGAVLVGHAKERARGLGAETLQVLSDPYAVGFYERMGAARIGEISSKIPGRSLPLLELPTDHDSRVTGGA